MTTNVTPTRKQAKIPTTICTRCFVAIPDAPEQRTAHIEWHEARKAKEVAE